MLTKPDYYYVIPNKVYRLDGTEVQTVSYNKTSGNILWKYKDSESIYKGKLGVDIFLKDPSEIKLPPFKGDYIRAGYKVKLFNKHTNETGWYVLVYKRGDTSTIPPIRTTGGKYYGEITINSFFGQELKYLQVHDYAIYYTKEGKVKRYRVEYIEKVRGLYE